MKTLQILMPMGGLGSRFKNAGFSLPKPLIEVDGMPMFLKAASSLDGLAADKTMTFVIRQDSVDEQQLDQLIAKAFPKAQITVIPKLTRGAAETALAAQDSLSPNDPLIVMDCDLFFHSESYNRLVQDVLDGTSDAAGGLLTFTADNPRYSYAKFDTDSVVTETAEKNPISEHAITGAYFFATAGEFIHATETLMQKPISPEMPEYYMSLLYNILIDEGKKIIATFVDEFASFGTPEELAAYQSR
jgi:dTDP-glucose pyrophosphorylase